MKHLLIRLSACYQILSGKRKHWYLVSMTTEELKQLLTKDDCEFQIKFHKLQMYNIMEHVRRYRNSFDDIDLLEERLKFEIVAEAKTKN